MLPLVAAVGFAAVSWCLWGNEVNPAGFAGSLPLGVICWLSLFGGRWGGGDQSWLNWKRSAVQVFRKGEKTIWTCKLNELWCRRYREMVSVASCQVCLWSNCVSDLEEEVKCVHLKRILIKHNEFDWSSGLLWAGDGSLIKGEGLAPEPFYSSLGQILETSSPFCLLMALSRPVAERQDASGCCCPRCYYN